MVEMLLTISKCHDFVVNKGHYFGTNLQSRRSRAQRRRQARADRVPEDDVTREVAATCSSRCLAFGASASPVPRSAIRRRARVRRRGRRPRERRTRPHAMNAPRPGPRAGDVADAEFIVVGSGAGGGTVAARLAEAGFQRPRARGGRRSAHARRAATRRRPERTRCPTTTTCRPSMPSRPRTRRCAGTSSSGTTPTMRSSGAIRTTARRGTASRWTACCYPRAGTLGGCTAHNAMIFVCPHDADWNQLADLTGDPSWRAEQMRAYFERLEHCDYRPLERLPQPARHEPEPPRLGRLAAHGARRPDGRCPRPGHAQCAHRFGARHPRSEWVAPSAIGLVSKARRDPERLARRARRARRAALHADDHARPRAHGRARAPARRAAAAPGPSEDRAARAGHARAVRRHESRDRRRVPEGRAAVPCARPAERGRRRACVRHARRAR